MKHYPDGPRSKLIGILLIVAGVLFLFMLFTVSENTLLDRYLPMPCAISLIIMGFMTIYGKLHFMPVFDLSNDSVSIISYRLKSKVTIPDDIVNNTETYVTLNKFGKHIKITYSYYSSDFKNDFSSLIK
jgi:Ca2+/Na+ antiporter